MEADEERAKAEAVRELYRVMRGYVLGGPLVHCDCCMTAAAAAVFREAPLRELDAASIGEYMNSAHDMTTPTARDQLRYLLPRIFEVFFTSDCWPVPMTEPAFSKLRSAGFPGDWPAEEVAAVRTAFTQWLFLALDGSRREDLLGLLAAFSNAGDPVDFYLDLIDGDETEAATVAIASLVADERRFDARILSNLSWWDDRGAHDRVFAWATSDAMRARFEAAFFSATSDAARATISRAHELIADPRRGGL